MDRIEQSARKQWWLAFGLTVVAIWTLRSVLVNLVVHSAFRIQAVFDIFPSTNLVYIQHIFAYQVFCGFVAGLVFHLLVELRVKAKVARWVWIAPALLLPIPFVHWHPDVSHSVLESGSAAAYLQAYWDHFFAHSCDYGQMAFDQLFSKPGWMACRDQLAFMAPLYFSLFALGAFAADNEVCERRSRPLRAWLRLRSRQLFQRPIVVVSEENAMAESVASKAPGEPQF